MDDTEAWRLFQTGEFDAALAAYEGLLAQAPDDAKLLTRYGRVLPARKPELAEPTLRRALELDPSNVEAIIALADWQARSRRAPEAEALYEAALAIDPIALHAILGLARLKSRSKRHSDAYVLYARALKVAPDSSKVHALFAKALLAHASRLSERALELDPRSRRAALTLAATHSLDSRPDEARAVFERAEAQDPRLAKLRHLAGVASADGPPLQRRRPAVWPRLLKQFGNLEKTVRDHVLPGSFPAAPILSKASRVVTMGSCFAEHIANALAERNVNVWFQKRSESLDNLFANRRILEWVAAPSSENAEFAPEESAAGYTARFEAADVVIISLGVAAAYFDRTTGELVVPVASNKHLIAAQCEFRMLSVDENAQELRRIIALLRQMSPQVKIVLTVSPIPLAATLERESAIQADAVSKSTMRLAVESVMREGLAEVYYWPSFEVVRWCGAHLPSGYPPVFGADDGASRHVSLWLVRMIIRLFLEVYGEGFVETAEQVPEPAPA